jgi:isoleucyl-tRNA synthetase
MSFAEVPSKISFPQLEVGLLQRWSEEKTFERSLAQRQGCPHYVFYDGPPFATGLPHYGHIMTSYIKDVVPRYFTMMGYYVPRRWGWDCHGLPIEYEAEKDLGFKTRADILAYGIGNFNQVCRNLVLRYSQEWKHVINRLGRWVDFDNAYKTMDASYMESVLWAFKALHERGLTYEGEKVVPYCIRCQTSLSNFEARLDDAFRARKDPAITVAFPRKGYPDESFLIWTTTPWTLPSNVGIAVGEGIEYVALRRGDETLWLAAESIGRYTDLKGLPEVCRAFGRDLVDIKYEPLFPYFRDTPNAFRILAANFVETGTGTGFVHLAPAFGEDDNAVCTAAGITGPNPVRGDGIFDERVSDFAGQQVFEANPHIIRYLKKSGRLVSQTSYEHDYPHCWRCDSPLIYRAVKSWFIKVKQIKERMLRVNAKINWTPHHVRDGRFGMWLENAQDWAVSRSRFWGAPVPVWTCESCQEVEVIGSLEELSSRSGQAVLDLHRPSIDEIIFPCPRCGASMSRIPDVFDCWFESGAMPFSQLHYPFENRQHFEDNFPGDFIVEYIAQTRGWFYTLVVLASALFEKEPFRNVVCHGVLLGEDGRKMSKRLRNYPDPMELVEEYGSDALRVGLLTSPVVRGFDARFSRTAVHDAVRRIHIPLWNSLHFFTAYAKIDGFEPTGQPKLPSVLDRYLLSKTDALRESLEERMSRYDFPGVYEDIVDYITMLSGWYIRLIRRRAWGAGIEDEKRAIYECLYCAFSNFAKLVAPFLPFLAESLHQALGETRSVHLEDWPKPRPAWRDEAAERDMDQMRQVVYLARHIRESHDIKHRVPLRSVSIAGLPKTTLFANRELLLEELNVKNIHHLESVSDIVRPIFKLNYGTLGQRLRGDVKKVAAALEAGTYDLSEDRLTLRVNNYEFRGDDFSIRYESQREGTGVAVEGTLVVVLDLKLDDALVAEGKARLLNRHLQNLRKEAGLAYADRVIISVRATGALQIVVDQYRDWLTEQLLAKEILAHTLSDAAHKSQVEIDGETIEIALRIAD